MTLLMLLACQGPSSADAPPIDLSGLPLNRADAADLGVVLDAWFTTPGTEKDGGEDPLLDDALIELIEATTTTLDLGLFDFDHEGIIQAVLKAHERGVVVRMVGDGDEEDDAGYAQLMAAGIDISMRQPRDRIMHNKFVVADGQVVWTGSTNATDNGIYRNNNNGLLIQSDALAAEYTAEFEQMFTETKFGRKKGDVNGVNSVDFRGQDVEFWFSPEHKPVEALVATIDEAQVSIRFMVFSFTHQDVVDALVRAQARGVDVVGVFDTSQARGRYSKDEALAEAGIPVYLDGNENASGFSGGKLHHKVLLVDAQTPRPILVTGSFNWSNSGTDYNDENTLILREPGVVELYRQEFCRVAEVAILHPSYTGELPTPCITRTAQLFINEALPNPVGTDRPAEFIEIVNGSTGSVELDGWTLWDESTLRHTFGAQVLGPGEAVVVTGATSTTAYLSLNNGSEVVQLRSPSGELVDLLEYGTSHEGETWNRSPDGDPLGGWVAASPTPWTRTDGSEWVVEPPQVHLIVNEVFPNPTGTDLGQEFVEIVNVGEFPADLEGWRLGDLSRNDRHLFADVVLEPGEALLIWDRGEHSEGILSSSEQLSLNNSGDVVTLYDADGDIHDSVAWTSTSAGVSLNRAVDGSAGQDLVDHDTLSDLTHSPGLRADGSGWLQ